MLKEHLMSSNLERIRLPNKVAVGNMKILEHKVKWETKFEENTVLEKDWP